MKNRYIIISLFVVIAAAFSIWLLIHSRTLGNITLSYSVPETSVTSITFSGEAGDTIKISFTSNIENGDLEIIIYDSRGNIVKKLDRAKRLETFLSLETSDTYKLSAEYKDFIGSCKVVIY